MQTIINQNDLLREIGCTEAAIKGILANLDLKADKLDPAPCVKGWMKTAQDLLAAAAKKQAAWHV